MGELINNGNRKELLKHMILQLHEGEAPTNVKQRLVDLLRQIPYNEVVKVEQELINEGLPEEEVLKFCDIHTLVLEGNIDQAGAKYIPPGHPVDTFKHENRELEKIIENIRSLFKRFNNVKVEDIQNYRNEFAFLFNALLDVDKHYKKKENLVFPYLEKKGITGPPKVMWGKHDEVRDLLKASIAALNTSGKLTKDEMESTMDRILRPAAKSLEDMIMKEEEILFPMAMDEIPSPGWYEIYKQTPEIGFCLYDPVDEWKPDEIEDVPVVPGVPDHIHLPTGSFSLNELPHVLNTLPFDITYVDSDDKVKYFSQGKERIFDRSRAILNRDVRMCHPPSSVHVVEQILDDFKKGKEDSAPFWINFNDKFIYIEYFPVRDEGGNYLGTIEVTQDITGIKKLKGEQRLLDYTARRKNE